MSHDIRMACASLFRRPGFAATAVFTMALAAAANAAILGAVYGILLKPLPFQAPDRLVAVWPGRFLSNADLVYLREHASMFSSIAAVAPGWTMSLTGEGEPLKLTVARVSGNLFETLGAPPVLGRALRDEDARTGGDSVIVLSHALWLKQFGGDPGVVGRVISLEGDPFEVVGVAAPDFEVFGLKADAYTPFALNPGAWYHRLTFSMFVARLAAGRSLEQASRDYRALIPRIRNDLGYPDDYGRTARLEELKAATVGDVRPSLVALGAAVAAILLIACANIGTLLLTRAAGRSREIAIRAAVGASRGRIARELAFEGLLIALAGAVVGTAAAWLVLPAIATLLPRDTPRIAEVAVTPGVAAAVLAASGVAGLLFALLPGLASLRVHTSTLMRAGSHSETRQGKVTRGLMVSAEIALALVLTAGAGLMLQTLWRMQRIDPGFSGDRVLTMHLQPPNVGGKGQRTTAGFYELVFERLRAIPGVTSVGAIQHLPFSGYSWSAALDIEGVDVPAGTSRPVSGLRIATPGYFRTLGQPLLAGRDFVNADLIHTGSAATGVVIVNQALADKFFGGAAAAPGRRLRIRGGGIQGQWLTVIGVVGNVRHDSLVTAPVPEIYTTISDTSINAMMVAVRTGGDPLSLVPAVRSAIWSVDRHTPISDVQTLSARVGASLARPRLLGVVLGGLASVGLLLVVLGVYGVVAYSVAQRTREIGIMIALGAERGRVVGSVLSEGLRFAVLGTAVGVPAALAATRLLRTVLYGVTPADPATYVALVAFTIALVSAACSVPAWRAARVDPLVSIRTE